MPSMKASDVLAELDRFALSYDFPVLDNGFIALAAVRLHAYADDSHWAIIIEQLGFNHREEGHEQIQAGAYAFGDATRTGLVSIYERAENGDRRPVLGPGPTADADEPVFDDDDSWLINSAANALMIRGTRVAIPRSPEVYDSKGIVPAQPGKLMVHELLRALCPEYKDALLYSEEQLRRIIPPEMNKLLTLEEWRHVDFAKNERPSSSAAFHQIAQVLVTRNPELYVPAELPNTHWKNWPKGGRS